MPLAIEVVDLHKRYGALQALDGVSLAIQPGEFFGLLGPNGAGKTTLISILAGLARADRGVAKIMGHDVRGAYREARRNLGVVPQELVFDPFFTPREMLRFQSGYFGLRNNNAWIDEILAALDLVPKADTNMRSLSGGMKRRVLVAQALVHRPPVIVLDEPTAGVDVALRQSLWAFIRRLNGEGHTIVLTTHYLEEAETQCGRIAMLNHGRIVALDSTDNLVRRVDSLNLQVTTAGASIPAGLNDRIVARDGSQVTLRLHDFNDVEPTLATLRLAGCTITEMALQQPDLEDVFLQLTGSGAATSLKTQGTRIQSPGS